jgi:hypothetical protein
MHSKVELWINAFIPRDVLNYTKTVKAGIYAGQTAVPLPGIARLHPGNLLKPWNEGFLTDQRTFSSSKGASVRMQSSATVTISPTGLTAIGNAPTTSGTIGVDIVTGKVLGRASANLKKCKITVLPNSPGAKDIITGVLVAPGIQSAVIELTAAGSDPLVAASAAIDYVGKFQVLFDPKTTKVVAQFSGKIDAFPAFEAYASYRGATKKLFTAPPPPGNTVVNLLGGANRPVSGSAAF